MNLEIYQDKKHFRNFCSIFIKLAQKMRYRLLNTSCKFHQNPFINKDFFSIRQSIENTMNALTGPTLFSPLRIYSRYDGTFGNGYVGFFVGRSIFNLSSLSAFDNLERHSIFIMHYRLLCWVTSSRNSSSFIQESYTSLLSCFLLCRHLRTFSLLGIGMFKRNERFLL